jgi:predicted amidophosphoribosyltransferase
MADIETVIRALPLRVGHCDCCDRPQKWLSRRNWCRRCEKEFLTVRLALINRGIIQHEAQ